MKNLLPYQASVLLGLSTGGIVALEVIHQLKYQNFHAIPDLILLDSPLPNIGDNHIYRLDHAYGEDDSLNALLLLLLANYAVKSFGIENTHIMQEDYFLEVTQSMTLAQKEEYIYNWIKSNTTTMLPSFYQFQQWIKLIATNIFAIANYVATPYEDKQVKVNYISSSCGTDPFRLLIPNNTLLENIADKKIGWSRLFPNVKVDYHMIPNSDHYTMFKNENMKVVAGIITAILLATYQHIIVGE